jgi:NADH dehydrogenase I D subunit
MKFSRSVEAPVWEKRETDILTGDSGIRGYEEVEQVDSISVLNRLQELKDQQGFTYFFDITATDETQRSGRNPEETHELTVQYSVMHPDTGAVRLLRMPVESVEKAIVPSATGVFKGADWYEREVFDMFGLKFENHPNMRRILMPDWWQGHPLRKSHPNRATEMEPLVVSTDNLDEFVGFETFSSSGDSVVRTVDEKGDELLILNLGPNHPGTHGVLRVVLQLDGEYLSKVYPVIGYHHRGAEKIAERQTFHTYIPYTDRVDYLAGVYNELPYVMACEQLADVKVPERAQVMRIMIGEMYRICNHLVWLGTLGHDVGAMTPVFYTFRERENLFKIIEMITGGRMHPNFLRIGGCSMDLPVGWKEPIKLFLETFHKHVEEYSTLMLKNPIFESRTRDVGKMSLEDCLDYGVSGPNLRASGTNFDLRKKRPYMGYEAFEFEVPYDTDGDCRARAVCRHAEMIESAKIIRQCLDLMPPGEHISRDNRYAFPVNKAETMQDIEALINHFLSVTWGLNMPPGESFCYVEQPKGIAGYHLVSDGRTSPYRLRIRTPSFAHMQTLPALSKGHMLSDLLAIIAAMDFVLADVDR